MINVHPLLWESIFEYMSIIIHLDIVTLTQALRRENKHH